ncbi:helix-turn-helix domain-containing protein [Streptomyces sp. NPDC059991]|uniref:helix-turn-helix domain-containing protein n=1 Tax=unclassified Streptomyces TaxID=2593676 RepID=UPI0036D1419F
MVVPADPCRTAGPARRGGARISRRCPAKWYARWRAHGQDGLLDRSSRPVTSPARTAEHIADLVEAPRRQTKHGPARLAADLQRLRGVTVVPTTVHRILVRRGLTSHTGRTSTECCGTPPAGGATYSW